MPSGTYTTVIEYGGIAVVLGTMMCCAGSVMIYLLYTYFTMAASPAQAAGPQLKKKKAAKKVKSSRLGPTED